MKTVTLELLRHGPAHNQLLSPLTQYLALCGNHPAVTLYLPFEHKQLSARFWDLGYTERSDPQRREHQLKDTAAIMGEILSHVPGLIAELAENSNSGDRITHVRLILSASELALLPFEMATAPNGFPGSGQALALQAQLPLCLTREVRRVNAERLNWLKRPRVLFVAGSPGGVGPIPFESHLLALRKVIDPWVDYFDERDSEKRKRAIQDHLRVLPQANVDQIQDACADGEITHVHILAHGVPSREAGDERFGLALHDVTDPRKMDIVDGVRLAALLRTPDRHGGISGPTVVTLASCDSANQGSVIGAGASIAHAIHEAGVPLVIGSQFPLSFAASVLMVQVLYEELLWGKDPRVLLHDLRMQLKSRIKDTHDWASLVSYAALPFDLEDQLPRLRFEQARRSINVALNRADVAISMVSDLVKRSKSTGTGTGTGSGSSPSGSSSPGAEDDRADALLDSALARIEPVKGRLNPLAFPHDQRVEVYGLLASTEKRQAEVRHRAAYRPRGADRKTQLLSEVEEGLRSSREYYLSAFDFDKSNIWPLVQYLVLTAVLEGPQNVPRDLWTTARVLSERNLHHENRKEVAWARGNLIELYLLASAMPPGPDIPAVPPPAERATEYARQLNRSKEVFEIYSTRRQILRYVEFFNFFNGALQPLSGPASAIYEVLSAGAVSNLTP